MAFSSIYSIQTASGHLSSTAKEASTEVVCRMFLLDAVVFFRPEECNTVLIVSSRESLSVHCFAADNRTLLTSIMSRQTIIRNLCYGIIYRPRFGRRRRQNSKMKFHLQILIVLSYNKNVFSFRKMIRFFIVE